MSQTTSDTMTATKQDDDLTEALPPSLVGIEYDQTVIPRLAKDTGVMAEINQALRSLPTRHEVRRGDAREMSFLEPESVHLIVTSPPYWTLKEYRDGEGQMGHIEDYECFLDELDRVWEHCFRALVPGGRVVCVVGDVCLSRRKNGGRHTVVPLHASIQERCRRLGFDNLTPIIWHKIANATFEVEGGGAGFLGKPYEPNAVIKNDIEFILMERKPGGYRKPTWSKKLLSIIPADMHRQWFQQIWSGLTGASTRNHPAPYPVELAERLIRMFSFAGDIVLDPFGGTGSTAVAASNCGRNSIIVEIDDTYHAKACARVKQHCSGLFSGAKVENTLRETVRAVCAMVFYVV